MRKVFFVVAVVLILLLVGCGSDDEDPESTESVQNTVSETSRVVKKIRQELLKSDFTFKTENESDIAILSAPDTITYDSVYAELEKNDDPYIIVTAKVMESRSFDLPEGGHSLNKIRITKVHKAKPEDSIKVNDVAIIYESFYQQQDNEGNAVLRFTPVNDNLYYSPLLIEDEEYIFFLANKNRINERTLPKVDPGHEYFWYNHAAFKLNFEYVEQYTDQISSEELIKTFAEGKISKKTFFYQVHKDVLEKFNK